jgi:hypothetical protein
MDLSKRRFEMVKKGILKFVVAFGLLAVLLVFLGVNYAPRISALAPANDNVKSERMNFERAYSLHPEAGASTSINSPTGADRIEQHPASAAKADAYVGSQSYRPPMQIGHDFGAP